MKKCSNCDFELEENQTICPHCGAKQPNEEQVVSEEENHSAEIPVNDNIQWSELHDVPLGSVMEQFTEMQEESEEQSPEMDSEINDTINQIEESSAPSEQETVVENEELEEHTKEALILAEYIRRHKDTDEVFEETLEEVVAAVQAGEQPEANEETEESENEIEEATNTPQDSAIDEEIAVVEETTAPDNLATENTLETEGVETTVEEPVKGTEVEATPTPDEVQEPTKSEETQVIEDEIVEEAIIEESPEEVAAAEATVIPEEVFETEVASSDLTESSIDAQPKSQVTEESSRVVKPTKRKKKPYIITAAVLVLAGGGWFYYDHQQKVEAARQEQLRIEKAVDGIESQLNSFYLDADQQYIAPEKSEALLSTTLKELEQYTAEEKYDALVAEGQAIQDKLATIDQVNQYFTAPIVVGDQLQKDVHIKVDSPMDMSLLTTDDAFSKLVNQAIEQGQAESKALQAANKAVQSLLAGYQKGKLSDAVSRKDVESTKKMVTELFASDEKEKLTKDVATVEAALVKREEAEKAAKEKAAAEEKARQERAAQEERARQAQNAQTSPSYNEGQEILSPNTPKNNLNQPIISSRQSDLNDANNPAWNWAPGVYDQVIQTAIQRGYIVEGGYKLERVRIENGEGYYNLYATNTQSALMKGIGESALPMYLFTINDKTGYFRGNGNN